MFSVTVSDHLMIAHSFRGALFGPAQRLHGATYAVEVELRRRTLGPEGVVADIGRAREMLAAVLAPLAYRNLDDLADFAGVNTTTEFLAAAIHARFCAAIRADGFADAGTTADTIESVKVVLRESPVAWAAFEGPLAP